MGNSKVVLLLILCFCIAHAAQGGKRPRPVTAVITGKKPNTNNPPCTIQIQDGAHGSPADINEKSPLLLKLKYTPSPSLDSGRFILPSALTDILIFQPGEKILLACPGRSTQEFEATCIGGKIFNVAGQINAFANIKCPETPKSSVQKSGNCGAKEKLHIGFKLTSSFLKLVEICYDSDALRAIYSKYTLSQGIERCQKVGRSCSYFALEPYNDKLPKDFYKCVNQKSTFEELIGRNKYIDCTGHVKSYLAKGHLASFADFVYYTQRKATMYHINAVPQWQKFNNANWKVLENKIRSYASKTKSDLTIYTGDFGVLKLSGQKHNNVQMFLGKERGGSRPVVPVPEQMYKVVCDDSKKKGMVFIGINRVNWDGTKFDDSNFRICKNECVKTDLYSGNTDPATGFIYCCTLPEFLKNNYIETYFPAELKHYQPLKQ